MSYIHSMKLMILYGLYTILKILVLFVYLKYGKSYIDSLLVSTVGY